MYVLFRIYKNKQLKLIATDTQTGQQSYSSPEQISARFPNYSPLLTFPLVWFPRLSYAGLMGVAERRYNYISDLSRRIDQGAGLDSFRLHCKHVNLVLSKRKILKTQTKFFFNTCALHLMEL